MHLTINFPTTDGKGRTGVDTSDDKPGDAFGDLLTPPLEGVLEGD